MTKAKQVQKNEELEGIKKTELYLSTLFRAHFPFIYIPTWEEARVVKLIKKIASTQALISKKRRVFEWSITEGLNELSLTNESKKTEEIPEKENPIEALRFIENYDKDAILILKDLHCFLGGQSRTPSINLIRKIRDVASFLESSSKNVVILAPSLVLPTELQKDITVVDFELPNLDELKKELTDFCSQNNLPDLNEMDKDLLCKAAQGLTQQEVKNAFARAAATRKRLTVKELDIILEEKCQVIKKTGILEFIKSNVNIDDVGGLENLKKWLAKRNKSWLGTAQKDYNLPAPKGVLITGVPGCGKSLTAKAMSAMWQLPLLRLDVGKIFSGLVGSSEENMRKAIQTAEAVSPSILWIDEIEKGFGGSTGGERDGGTTSRVFGTFLTWMNEKTKPVFVIATANNIHKLPSEMLRKGRFDEIFFVDLPTFAERKVIFKLHLAKRLKNSVSKDFQITDKLLNSLAKETEGFGGSEIEQAVIDALFEAFAENRTLKEDDLFKAIKNTVPLSNTQAEQILAIRQWSYERAVAASARDEDYNYVPDAETIQLKEKEKETTETIKRSRGGRIIDF